MLSTEETRGMFWMEQFKRMKGTAWLINAARGELVKEKELIGALSQGVIAGAALDVFEKEPPKKDSGLFQLENVILSPHNAALTKEAMERMAVTAAKAVDDVLSGRKPQFVVAEGK